MIQEALVFLVFGISCYVLVRGAFFKKESSDCSSCKPQKSKKG